MTLYFPLLSFFWDILHERGLIWVMQPDTDVHTKYLCPYSSKKNYLLVSCHVKLNLLTEAQHLSRRSRVALSWGRSEGLSEWCWVNIVNIQYWLCSTDNKITPYFSVIITSSCCSIHLSWENHLLALGGEPKGVTNLSLTLFWDERDDIDLHTSVPRSNGPSNRYVTSWG